jgi:hypothetical protein
VTCLLLTEALYGQCQAKPSKDESGLTAGSWRDSASCRVLYCLVLSCLVAYHVTWQRCRIWATKDGIFSFCSSSSSAGVPLRVSSPIQLTTHCHKRSSCTWVADFVIPCETSSVPEVNLVLRTRNFFSSLSVSWVCKGFLLITRPNMWKIESSEDFCLLRWDSVKSKRLLPTFQRNPLFTSFS